MDSYLICFNNFTYSVTNVLLLSIKKVLLWTRSAINHLLFMWLNVFISFINKVRQSEKLYIKKDFILFLYCAHFNSKLPTSSISSYQLSLQRIYQDQCFKFTHFFFHFSSLGLYFLFVIFCYIYQYIVLTISFNGIFSSLVFFLKLNTTFLYSSSVFNKFIKEEFYPACCHCRVEIFKILSIWTLSLYDSFLILSL